MKYSNFVSEIVTLSKLYYPTILSIYGYKEDNSYMIFTEYMEKGSFESFFYNSDKYKELDYDNKFIIGYGIALGMKYLYKQNISHRDLKLSNILINDKYYPIICDFGFSKFLTNSVNSTNLTRENGAASILGTPLFCVPEINLPLSEISPSNIFSISSNLTSSTSSETTTTSEISGSLKESSSKSYNPMKSDVYSFGIVLLCLFLESQKDVLYFFQEYNRLELKSIKNQILQNLIQNCCDIDPNKRPDFDSIVEIMNQIFQKNLSKKKLYQEFRDFIEEKDESKKEIIPFQQILDDCFNKGVNFYREKSNLGLFQKYMKIAASQGSLDANYV